MNDRAWTIHKIKKNLAHNAHDTNWKQLFEGQLQDTVAAKNRAFYLHSQQLSEANREKKVFKHIPH